jgi:hypothetical protein
LLGSQWFLINTNKSFPAFLAVPIRKSIVEHAFTAHQITRAIADAFVGNQCEGLFLTAVSSDGIRLPVNEIVEAIEQRGQIRFIAIDGAQEFAHCHSRLRDCRSDLYLFGGHKWLGSHFPLAMALYGRKRSRAFIETTLARQLDRLEIEDPLLRFLSCLRDGSKLPTDTFNFLPLFATAGALAEPILEPENQTKVFVDRLDNMKELNRVLNGSEWSMEYRPRDSELSTAITMLRNPSFAHLPATRLENHFKQRGITLSGYERGRVRVSMPNGRFNLEDVAKLKFAFGSIVSSHTN